MPILPVSISKTAIPVKPAITLQPEVSVDDEPTAITSVPEPTVQAPKKSIVRRVSQEEFFGEDINESLNVTADEFSGGGEINVYQPQNEEEKLNFAQRFGEDLKKRRAMAVEIRAAQENGEQSTAETMLQIAGKLGAGAVMDFMGEVIISAGRGLSAITPDVVEQPIKAGAAAVGVAFLNTELGQQGLNAAKKGMEDWFAFKNENPRAARNIEAVVDVGLLFFPAKGKPKVKAGPTPLAEVGEKVEQAAAKQVARTKSEFVQELVIPKETAAVKVEQVSRTVEKGFLRTKQVIPSASEKTMAEEVIKIQEVGKSKTLQGNFNAIEKEVAREADNLKTALAEKDVIFPRKEFNAQLNEAMKRLQDNPLIVGDAEKTAERIVQKMQQITNGKKSKASELLQARKELDSWIKSQKGPNIFDPKQETAISIAIREIRHTTNDFIDSKATNVGVKESLKKQSTLLRAMDNISPKAADEANNAILRTWQTTHRIIPLRGEFNQTMAALFGLGGLGASAVFAPFFTKLVLGGAVVYGMGKVLMSPQAKKGVGLLLKETDRAIRATKDEALISQLRLDRALIVELLELAEENLRE